MIKRRKTKIVRVGNLKVGGNFPIWVQSMTKTKTFDVKATLAQIKNLEKAGCEIIRVGVPDLKSAKILGKIKKEIKIPLVADIHFSADLALEAIKQGVDKIRINPGNFPQKRLEEVVNFAKRKGVAIRIGINSGSLEKDILKKYGRPTAKAMVESALRNINIMEKLGFYDLIISLKSSDILETIKAYEILAKKVDYPFHLGITEAGEKFSGTIKSVIGISNLLLKGIGDTIRVSLSADPVEEVRVGWEILKSLGIRKRGVEIISCPMCARSSINVFQLTEKIKKLTEGVERPVKIAIMGCVVNGIGEGRKVNLAIVGAGNFALIMKDGKIVKRAKKGVLFESFKKEFENYLKE